MQTGTHSVITRGTRLVTVQVTVFGTILLHMIVLVHVTGLITVYGTCRTQRCGTILQTR